jgi:hypothetical protein
VGFTRRSLKTQQHASGPELSSPLAMTRVRLVRVAGQVQSTFQATRAWFADPTVRDEVARASCDAFPSGLPVWELP